MVRVTDYETRRRDILKATIELYLDSAQPVGSQALLEQYRFNMSPATVRNVLKDLEEMGYLAHTHTSSGRIPTDDGYHFYINNLMHEIALSKEEKNTLGGFFESYLMANREILENVSEMLSNFTHYVGIASSQDMHKISYKGLSYLLEQPELKDIDKIHSIFKALEEDRLLDLMSRKMDKPIEVKIGDECDYLGLNYCSLVISECSKSGKKKGKLAVLGPRRMAYHQVIPMIDYLSELIANEMD